MQIFSKIVTRVITIVGYFRRLKIDSILRQEGYANEAFHCGAEYRVGSSWACGFDIEAKGQSVVDPAVQMANRFGHDDSIDAKKEHRTGGTDCMAVASQTTSAVQ